MGVDSPILGAIPIAERLAAEERTFGVRSSDLTTGQVVALVKTRTAV